MSDRRDDWKDERMKHPFVGEGMTKKAMFETWDNMSEKYDGRGYIGIIDRIVSDLESMGVLSAECSVLDIGCGPGLYSMPFAKRVGKVYCTDSSKGMLARLSASASEAGIRNIDMICSDWDDFPTDRQYDVVFSSLCPPTNSPESLSRMESMAKRFCVYISSINEPDSLHVRAWRRLGKDYSFVGYNTEYPLAHLKGLGRDVVFKTYEVKTQTDLSAEEAFEAEVKRFLSYRKRTPEIEAAVRAELDPLIVNGRYRHTDTTRLGMLVWSPPKRKWKGSSSNGVTSSSYWDFRSEQFGSRAIPTSENDGFVALMERECSFSKGKTSILDIGCGSGIYSLAFADRAGRILGTDVSPKMIDYAKKNAAAIGADNAEFIVADWLGMKDDDPLIKDGFDIVIAHMTPAISSAETFGRMLKAARGKCFLTSYISRGSVIRDRLREITSPFKPSEYEKLVNASEMLWRKGLEPRIDYERKDYVFERSVEDTKEFYLNDIRTFDRPPKDRIDEAERFIESLAVGGKVRDESHALIATLYWDMK